MCTFVAVAQRCSQPMQLRSALEQTQETPDYPCVRQTARKKEIEVWDGMSVTELAGQLKTSHGNVLKVLRAAGEKVKGRNPG